MDHVPLPYAWAVIAMEPDSMAHNSQAPPLSEYWPAGQAEHSEAPLPEKWPAVQSVQLLAAPSAEY